MHLLVAEGAVLEPRRAQIMQRRSDCSQVRVGRRRRDRKVGVTLHANESHFVPRQHPRIGRPMRLMARPAAFGTHRSVLEGKWPDLIAVTLRARGFVGAGYLNRTRQRRPVRVVAIHAGHGAFRQPVFVGLLEASPDVGVAGRALLVDFGGLADHQTVRSILVNRMARGATHLVFGMTAVETAGMSSLILMAGEADAIGLRGRQLWPLAEIGGGSRFGVFGTGSMA